MRRQVELKTIQSINLEIINAYISRGKFEWIIYPKIMKARKVQILSGKFKITQLTSKLFNCTFHPEMFEWVI